MKKTARGLLALAFGMIGATRAIAGIADSPLPVLVSGQATLHLYSVPGVINDDGTNLATFFSCTSASTSAITVGVELFGAAGGAPLNSVTPLSVPPGGTVTIGTSSSTFSDQTLGNPALSKGSARILSTSKSLICTASTADVLNTTPASGWALTIVAKTKQKSAN